MPSKTILQSLNKAYRRVTIPREGFEKFKSELANYYRQIAVHGREDAVRQDVINLLERVYYGRQYRVSPFEVMDIAIHLGDTAASEVGVIIEVKKIDNTQEMISRDNLNKKALQELLRYYLNERVLNNNTRLRKLVVTNTEEFFIFEPQQFEHLFFHNTALVRNFTEFSEGRTTFTDTNTFYRTVAHDAIASVIDEIEYTWFDIKKYKRDLEPDGSEERLVELYKVFSPENLLKKPFQTDSNRLNTKFYNELLYIIGLEEVKATKTGNKRIIRRLPLEKRNPGSLIEETISVVESLDYESRVHKLLSYGETREEQTYNIALTLVISWINRILFLKLLESQLKTYHPDEPSYEFLTNANLPTYASLDQLFFQVLAVDTPRRTQGVASKYAKVPYLNSSLFEISQLETDTISISSLVGANVPLYSSSILKRGLGASDSLPSLQYLLNFLAAYDFSSEGTGLVSDKSKTLINASVLGLIFEKINGHKDGAVFTPGTITMYMSRRCLRRILLRKFNERMNLSYQSFEDLSNYEFRDLVLANEIVDDIKICDISVGSGHFLVSLLNEIIKAKYDLGILTDSEGVRIRRTEYEIDIENDELIVTEGEGHPFIYRPGNRESQRIQKMLFCEKRKIIENCLFGVDINPNAVNICRLRLWIELLKNAYYTEDSSFTQLETLPNIDINIKEGNTLIHRFRVDADLTNVLRNSTISVPEYKRKVQEYKNAHSKEVKRELAHIISNIRLAIRRQITSTDPDVTKLKKAQLELSNYTDPSLFRDGGLNGFELIEVGRLNKKIQRLEGIIAEREKFAEINNAFEWRVEFPEILGENGSFEGFDLIIGNPPYISAPDQVKDPSLNNQRNYLNGRRDEYNILYQKWDLYLPFIELGLRYLLKRNGVLSMIIPFPATNQAYARELRRMLMEQYSLFEITDLHTKKVFDTATVQNCIIFADKYHTEDGTVDITSLNDELCFYTVCTKALSELTSNGETLVWNLAETGSEESISFEGMPLLGDICFISKGMVIHADENEHPGEFKKDDLISEVQDAEHSRQYIEAKDVDRYFIGRVRYLEYGTTRSPGHFSRKTFPELYERQRLVLNCLGRLAAMIDEQEHYLHNHSLYCAVRWCDLEGIDNNSISNSISRYCTKTREEMACLSNRFELGYLLGLLNSDSIPQVLISIRGADYHIYPEHLRKIPIPQATQEQQASITEWAFDIIHAKANGEIGIIEDREERINRLVRQLYGLPIGGSL